MLKHLCLAFIYGFLTLIAYMGNNYTLISFQSFCIIITWIIFLALIYEIQFFDKITDFYFVLTVLLFLAARLARYNARSIANAASYIAIGVGCGIVAECAYKNKIWPVLFLLGIFSIEITNIELDPKIDPVDISAYIPEI